MKILISLITLTLRNCVIRRHPLNKVKNKPYEKMLAVHAVDKLFPKIGNFWESMRKET